MKINLSSEDFAILLAFESNPFMPMTELADVLGVTRITAKKRVDDLKARDIIRTPIAISDHIKLGLHRINVIAEVKSIEDLKILEKACDEHPYTYYRVRAFAGNFKLFMQFNIPWNSEKNIKKFLDELQKKKIIQSYTLLHSIEVRTDDYADLKRYNAKLSTWNFSWKEWFDNVNNFSKKLPKEPLKDVDYSTFTQNHFKILRMLTANGSLKQIDIKEKLNISKTQAHREFNFVKDNYIITTRFIYNREIFDLTETYIAIGYDVPDEKIAQIYNAMEKNPPPFRLALDILENNTILLWGNMSPAQASGFAFSMWEHINTTQILTLDTKKSKMYWFYPENFDLVNQQWKVTEEYMVNEPLERILK